MHYSVDYKTDCNNRNAPYNIKKTAPEIQFTSIAMQQQKRLTRFYIIPFHQTNKTPSAATEQGTGLMEVSRAPAAPEQPAEPFEITGPHMTAIQVLKAIFIGGISNVASKLQRRL